MKTRSNDHIAIEALLREARSHLTAAGELVDPAKSLTHLRKALDVSSQAEHILHPGDGTKQPCETIILNLSHRHRHKLIGSEDTPGVITRILSYDAEIADPQADALLVSEGIPAVWRVVRGVAEDAHASRPWGLYRVYLTRSLIFLLAFWLIYEAGRLVIPFGSWIVYFNDPELRTPTAIRAGFKLHQDYGEQRPAAFTHRNGWSARWSGYIFAPRNDDYSFYIQSNDGVRFWIDDTLIIDNWRETNWQTSGQHATLKLSAGKHRFRMEHYKHNGNGAVRVRWTGGGVPENTILGYPYLLKY